MWPKPTACDGEGGPTKHDGKRGEKLKNLGGPNPTFRWPTPTSGDAKSSGNRNLAGSKAHAGTSLTDAVTGGQSPRRWATPTVADAEGGRTTKGSLRQDETGLRIQVKNWPTPGASDGEKMPRFHKGGNPSLEQAARTWATPTANHKRRSPAFGEGRAPSPDEMDRGLTRGQKTPPMSLNPAWVEWLMGWPIGWTALEPLETDKFLSWSRKHGGD